MKLSDDMSRFLCRPRFFCRWGFVDHFLLTILLLALAILLSKLRCMCGNLNCFDFCLTKNTKDIVLLTRGCFFHHNTLSFVKLKILSAKQMSRNVAINSNKHLRSFITDWLTQAIGHATKKWIIDLSHYFGVKHWRRLNKCCLDYFFPPVTLSPPTTHSTNGGSAGGDSSLLIGDKVFLAAVATACKSNFSALRWLARLARSKDEGVDGAEPWCTHDRTMGAPDASTPANNLARQCCRWWANASLPRIAPQPVFPAQARGEGCGSWANMAEYFGNTGGDGIPYPWATCSGN